MASGRPDSAYTYDAIGNLLSKSDYSTTAANAYRYTEAGTNCGPNFATSVLTPAGTDTYRCDANGNTIGGGTTYAATTKYDAANLPTAIARASGSALFWYDPLNRRAREYTGNDYTYFAGDGYERYGSTANGLSRHELGPVVVDATDERWHRLAPVLRTARPPRLDARTRRRRNADSRRHAVPGLRRVRLGA